MTRLEIHCHDGPARLGRLIVGKDHLPTPSGCFFRGVMGGFRLFDLEGKGFVLAVPPSAGVARGELEDLSEAFKGRTVITASPHGQEGEQGDCVVIDGSTEELEKNHTGVGLVILEYGLRTDPAQIVHGIVRLRMKLSPNTAILVPDAQIWSFPLFALAGADIFCDSHAWGGNLSGEMIFESYSIQPEKMEENPCCCPFCSRTSGNLSDVDILAHNRWMTGKVLSEIRTRIRLGEMKNLAEERSLSHPSLSAALKRLYREHSDYLEEHTTICPGFRP